MSSFLLDVRVIGSQKAPIYLSMGVLDQVAYQTRSPEWPLGGGSPRMAETADAGADVPGPGYYDTTKASNDCAHGGCTSS